MDNVLPNDPLFSQQWYLNNTGQSGGTPGEDINVLPAWEIATGDGVVIGFVDGAIELGHPDLDSQNNPLGGFDFIDDEIERFIPGLNAAIAVGFEFDLGSILDGTNLDSLNFLDRPSDAHGTPVAGIAIASNNNIGITGVAYDATFASYRIQFDDEIILDDFDELISSTFSRPSSVDIFNNSWLFPLPLVPLEESNQALERTINFGRGGLGNIFVFAAGNNAQQGGNVNYYPLTNSRYTITVGALDHNGVRSSYSNPGASLLISSYANTDEEGILTTDVRGESGFDAAEYTEFTGTSAATPIVSGVIALMLEANPDLTWRDIQHILVRTAVQNDIDNPDWIENGAGYSVNHNYGFGSIDATAAVTLSQEWTTVAPEISLSSPVIDIDVNVPDNDRDGITSIIDVEDDLTVESIEVITDADLVREDLKVVLTSPDGTESILSANDLNANREGTWTFTSLRHWGESSAGEWSLQVIDSEASTSETTWDSWQLNLYGTNDNLNSESTEEDNTDSGLIGNNNSDSPGSDLPGGNGSSNSSISVGADNIVNAGNGNSDFPGSNPPGGNGSSNFSTFFNSNPELQNSFNQSLIDSLRQSLSDAPNATNAIGDSLNSDDDTPNTPDSIVGDNPSVTFNPFETDGETILVGDNFIVIPDFENDPFFANAISSEATIVEIETGEESISVEEQFSGVNIAQDEVLIENNGNLIVPAVNITAGIDTPTTDPNGIGLIADGTNTPRTPDNILVPDGVNLPPDVSIRPINEPQVEVEPVYRLYNSNTGVHLYTISEVEKDSVVENLPNYTLEGIEYYGYTTQLEGTVPLYRFYNQSLDAHFYTPSVAERDEYIDSPDFRLEGDDGGIAFYVLPTSEI